MKENLTVKDILPTLLEDGTLKDNYGPEKNIEIQAQQFITIHGINMQRSELSVTDVADGTLTDFLVCYTFIYDHIPYLWKMDRGDFALFSATKEEADYVMSVIRLQADSTIRTIQFSK